MIDEKPLVPPSGAALSPVPWRGLPLTLAALVAIKLALFLAAAWKVRFVMDEMQFCAQILDFGEGLYSRVDPIKTALASYVFALPRLVAAGSAEQLLGARLLGAGFGLGIAALVYASSRRLGADRLQALLALATLLSFSPFMEHGFRIRADLFAALLACLGLFAAVGRRPPAARAWILGLCAGLAFVSTQKSIYILAAFLAATLIAGGEDSWRGRLGLAARLLAAWSLVLLAYALYFGGADFLGVIAKIFLTPRQLALRDHQAYPEIVNYLIVVLIRNLLAWALCLAGLLLALGRWRELAPRQRWAAVASAAILVLVFQHNQPWPYVFVLAAPFAAIWVPTLVAWAGPRRRFRVLVAVLLAVCFCLPLARNFKYPIRHGNYQQLLWIRHAEAQLAPQDRYFDAIGMLPARRTALTFPEWWWDRPTIQRLAETLRSGDRTIWERLFADEPKIFLLNYRFAVPLAAHLEPLLRQSYVRIDELLAVSGIRLEAGAASVFPCRWSGAYRLFDLAGLPLEEDFRVDGGPPGRAIEIRSGERRIERRPGARGAALLLPVGTEFSRTLPLDDPYLELFANIYNY